MPALPGVSGLAALPLFRRLRPQQLERLNAALRRTSFPADAPSTAVGQPGEVAYTSSAERSRSTPSRRTGAMSSSRNGAGRDPR
jgi:hypothetical protein